MQAAQMQDNLRRVARSAPREQDAYRNTDKNVGRDAACKSPGE